MYEKLFDTVSQIVRTYGVSILDDSKFWNILCDSYSFVYDYSLKDTFKKCISNGYVSRIVALCPGNKKTLDEIEAILKEAKNDGLNEEETKATLFSIAIGVGTCTTNDYNNYHRSQLSQSSTSRPENPAGQQNQSIPNTDTENSSPVSKVLFGIAILFGSSLFYSVFLYSGWYMLFVMAFAGLIQMAFLINYNIPLYNNRNYNYKSNAISCLIPILIGFILNDLVPFLMCIKSFRVDVYRYFSDFDYPSTFDVEKFSVDSPGIISLLWTLFVAICLIGFCLKSTISGAVECAKQRFPLNKRLFALVTGIIVIFYVLLFGFPAIKRNNAKDKILQDIELSEAKSKKQSLTNDSLRSVRADSTVELSFKGISLGTEYETAVEQARKLSNNERVDTSFFALVIQTPDDIISEILRRNKSLKVLFYNKRDKAVKRKPLFTPDKAEVFDCGDTFSFKTSIDNIEVDFEGLAKDERCFCFIVTPGNRRKVFFEFDNLLALYTTKYGEPEIYVDENEKTVLPRYLWNFKNGLIQLTHCYIVYISSEYISQVESNYKRAEIRVEKAQQRYEDSIRNEQLRNDSIRREKTRQDSIRRKRNHENAINEI